MHKYRELIGSTAQASWQLTAGRRQLSWQGTAGMRCWNPYGSMQLLMVRWREGIVCLVAWNEALLRNGNG
jgi:hypothetical protein